MSIFGLLPAQSLAPGIHSALVPQWLTHLGALGLFFVAVIDSSVIPLPLPGSTDLLLLFMVAHSGNPWLLPLAPLLAASWADIPRGTLAAEAAKRRCVTMCRRVCWFESSNGWSVTASLRCFFPLCFLHLFLIAVCTGLRRAGGIAPALSCGLWSGSQRALLLYCLARRSLRTQNRPPLVRQPSEMVNSAAQCFRGPARSLHWFWGMESSRIAQGRCRGETRIAGRGSTSQLNGVIAR